MVLLIFRIYQVINCLMITSTKTRAYAFCSVAKPLNAWIVRKSALKLRSKVEMRCAKKALLSVERDRQIQKQKRRANSSESEQEFKSDCAKSKGALCLREEEEDDMLEFGHSRA